jgi:hypothetical protein
MQESFALRTQGFPVAQQVRSNISYIYVCVCVCVWKKTISHFGKQDFSPFKPILKLP